jgi:hypothetical protein
VTFLLSSVTSFNSISFLSVPVGSQIKDFRTASERLDVSISLPIEPQRVPGSGIHSVLYSGFEEVDARLLKYDERKGKKKERKGFKIFSGNSYCCFISCLWQQVTTQNSHSLACHPCLYRNKSF